MKRVAVRIMDCIPDIVSAVGLLSVPKNEQWLILTTQTQAGIAFKNDSTFEDECCVDACTADGLLVTRSSGGGGTLLMTEGTFIGFLKGENINNDVIYGLIDQALSRLDVTADYIGNDVLIGNRKLMGFATVLNPRCHTLGFMGNISAPLDLFARYIKASEDKLQRHGRDYSTARVGRLVDHVEDITVEKWFELLIGAFQPDQVIEPEHLLANSQVAEFLTPRCIRAWNQYNVPPVLLRLEPEKYAALLGM